MITGIIISVLFVLVCSRFVAKRINSNGIKKFANVIHKPAALIMLIAAVVHLILTLKLFAQRPLLIYVAGGIMVICILFSIISYYRRKSLGSSWINIHRTCSVIVLFALCFHVFIGIFSLNEYIDTINSINLKTVDVSSVADGKYTGEFDAGYIYAKVAVIVKEGRIENIDILEHRNEKGKAAEKLTDEIIKKQSTVVDAISGATNSSCVIMKAVENALN